MQSLSNQFITSDISVASKIYMDIVDEIKNSAVVTQILSDEPYLTGAISQWEYDQINRLDNVKLIEVQKSFYEDDSILFNIREVLKQELMVKFSSFRYKKEVFNLKKKRLAQLELLSLNQYILDNESEIQLDGLLIGSICNEKIKKVYRELISFSLYMIGLNSKLPDMTLISECTNTSAVKDYLDDLSALINISGSKSIQKIVYPILDDVQKASVIAENEKLPKPIRHLATMIGCVENG